MITKFASTTSTDTTNLVIKNVEFLWAKLSTPVENSYSGDMQYEIAIQVPTARRADLEVIKAAYHPKNKEGEEDKSVVRINLKKKATKADGSPAAKVRVVDAAKMEIDPAIIGNGSKGNVIVMQKPFEIKNPKNGKVTKSGVSTSLSAVQVVELKEFKPTGNKLTDMFDEEGAPSSQVSKSDDF